MDNTRKLEFIQKDLEYALNMVQESTLMYSKNIQGKLLYSDNQELKNNLEAIKEQLEYMKALKDRTIKNLMNNIEALLVE